jgi:hypothetical protein
MRTATSFQAWACHCQRKTMTAATTPMIFSVDSSSRRHGIFVSIIASLSSFRCSSYRASTVIPISEAQAFTTPTAAEHSNTSKTSIRPSVQREIARCYRCRLRYVCCMCSTPGIECASETRGNGGIKGAYHWLRPFRTSFARMHLWDTTQNQANNSAYDDHIPTIAQSGHRCTTAWDQASRNRPQTPPHGAS